MTTVVPAEFEALTWGLLAAAFAPRVTFSPLVADDGTSSDARKVLVPVIDATVQDVEVFLVPVGGAGQLVKRAGTPEGEPPIVTVTLYAVAFDEPLVAATSIANGAEAPGLTPDPPL